MSTTPILPNIGLGKFSNASFAAFMHAFSHLIQKTPLEKLGLKAAEMTAFSADLTQLVEAHRQLRKDELTIALQELDKERDALLSYIFSKILNEVNAPEESLKAAAQALLALRSLYLDLPRKAQREETALIHGFLADTAKAEIGAHFTTLGLAPALAKLKTLNTEFEEKLALRSANQVENPFLSVRTLRQSLTSHYQNLSLKVFAFNLITPTAESQTFMLRLHKLIADTKLARRQHTAQLGVWTEEGGWEEEDSSSSTEENNEA